MASEYLKKKYFEGVYTRVKNYVSWIKKHAADGACTQNSKAQPTQQSTKRRAERKDQSNKKKCNYKNRKKKKKCLRNQNQKKAKVNFRKRKRKSWKIRR